MEVPDGYSRPVVDSPADTVSVCCNQPPASPPTPMSSDYVAGHGGFRTSPSRLNSIPRSAAVPLALCETPPWAARNLMLLRYETLTQSPAAAMAAVNAFLGE